LRMTTCEAQLEASLSRPGVPQLARIIQAIVSKYSGDISALSIAAVRTLPDLTLLLPLFY